MTSSGVSLRAGLILLATMVFAIGIGTGVFTPPVWVLWAGLIASGSMIYTCIHHRGQTERFTLTMVMILLALPNLSWPSIGLATLVGVSLGQLILAPGVIWYKRVYTATAISLAGIIAEIFYSSVPLIHGPGHDVFAFVAAALIFDILSHTFFAPVWRFVAHENLRAINRTYWNTFPLTIGSIVMAGVLQMSVEVWGVVAIAAWAVTTIMVARPEWTVNYSPFRVSPSLP